MFETKKKLYLCFRFNSFEISQHHLTVHCYQSVQKSDRLYDAIEKLGWHRSRSPLHTLK